MSEKLKLVERRRRDTVYLYQTTRVPFACAEVVIVKKKQNYCRPYFMGYFKDMFGKWSYVRLEESNNFFVHPRRKQLWAEYCAWRLINDGTNAP